MWTAKNRGRYDRSKLRYPSDLTDDEWAHVEPLIPPAKRGGNKRHVEVREVMNGIMYILSTGCQWRAIPKDLPPRSTLFDYLDLWSYDGTLDRIHHALYVACREQGEREASPTAAIVDSQSVKSAEKGGAASIRMAMTRQKGQGQEAPYSRRHAGFAAARHHSSCRYPRSRWRHPASCDPFRDVPFLEKALCRWWLSGAGLSKKPWRRSCHSSKLKSSSAPIGRKDSWCFHAVGSSNAPLLGSTAAEGLQRIGRTSIATRWRFCGSPQSASCSENFVIPPDVFGQTLRRQRSAFGHAAATAGCRR